MGLAEILIANLCLNATCPVPENPEPLMKIARLRGLMEELQKENLVVATLENEELSGTTNLNDSTVLGTGVAFDLLNILQRKFRFNYTVIKPESNTWGSDDKGVLSLLRTNAANLTAAFLPILTEYAHDISYSPGLDTGEWVVMMKRPKESATGSGLLAPFTLPVWLLILVSLLLVGPVIYFIIYVQAKLCKHQEESTVFPLRSCIWFVYGALLKQGTTLNPITDSSRMLFATWWIFITILTAFYTANLTAFLTLSKFTLPINAPSDIGAKRTKWVTNKGNALEDTILVNDTLSTLGAMLGKPVDYVARSDSYILKNYVEKSNVLFIREKPVVEYAMYADYKAKTRAGIEESKRCTYVITKFPIVSYSRAFAYAKDFKYKPLFDSAIQYLVESGIIKFKLREFLPDTKICPMDLGNKERQLRNGDLKMTYEIVGGGFLISALIFCIEVVMKRAKRHQQDNKAANATRMKNKRNRFDVNFNDGVVSKFLTPPPAYNTLFNAPGPREKIKKKTINGRDYWVYNSVDGTQQLVPLRTPSALLFQFTN